MRPFAAPAISMQNNMQNKYKNMYITISRFIIMSLCCKQRLTIKSQTQLQYFLTICAIAKKNEINFSNTSQLKIHG